MIRSYFQFIAVFSTFWAYSQEIFEREPTQRLVNDYAGVMSQQETAALENKLRRYADTTSSQICVVTVKTLNGYEVVDYATRIGEKWGIGIKGKNNGIVVLVATDDRKAAITTGYGMEATVTDAATRQIRDNYMGPRFREGNFYQGLDDATTAIIQLASGEFKASARPTAKRRGNSLTLWFLLIFFVVLPILRSINGARSRSLGSNGSTSFWTMLMLMSLGGGGRSSGGSGFDSGGDSWGGFGGGSFGGGGSGGDW